MPCLALGAPLLLASPPGRLAHSPSYICSKLCRAGTRHGSHSHGPFPRATYVPCKHAAPVEVSFLGRRLAVCGCIALGARPHFQKPVHAFILSPTQCSRADLSSLGIIIAC